jgi:uncharacterized protein (TIGR03437 family)
MNTRNLITVSILVLSRSHALGQVPSIAPNGVVNAASLAGPSPAYQPLAPQSLASIFGSNLATGTQAASSTPLPVSILGTTVSVNGNPAPLLFVSPTQINFQVPRNIGLSAASAYFLPVPVTVTSPNGKSVPVNFTAGYAGPALFTMNGSGCGPGVVQNVTASGEISLNSISNSVQPGEYLTAYGTGLLGPYDPPGDGLPGPLAPPMNLASGATADLGGVPQYASFSGLAPGFVGVDQINLRVPASSPEGCAVPLRISNYEFANSQPVTIAVRRGGGACVDPASAAEGVVILKKVTTVGSANDGTVETLDATFPYSPARIASPLVGGLTTSGYQPAFPAPSCPIPGYGHASAGTLTLNTQQSAIGVAASGDGLYHAVLPANTLQPGSYRISADGSGSVGAFQVTIPLGHDIQIQAPPTAGSAIHINGPVTPTWSGGDPNTTVTVYLISHFDVQDYLSSCSVPASAGHCMIPTTSLTGNGPVMTNSIPSPRGEFLFQIDPNPRATPFSAPGLSLGAKPRGAFSTASRASRSPTDLPSRLRDRKKRTPYHRSAQLHVWQGPAPCEEAADLSNQN